MSEKITSYWFVTESSNRPPLAMFFDAREAQDWRNEHYPDANIDKFELVLEDL